MTTEPPAASAWPRLARTGLDRLGRHLEQQYGITVTAITELDLGVFRVDRARGSSARGSSARASSAQGGSWVARVFPAARPSAAAYGDADVLRFAASRDFPAERLAHPEPVSTLDDQAVLVTEHVAGVRGDQRRELIRSLGGLHRLGQLAADLHALPAPAPAVTSSLPASTAGLPASTPGVTASLPAPAPGVTAGLPASAIAPGASADRPGGAWHHVADGPPAAEIAAARQQLDAARSLVPPGELAGYDALRAGLERAEDCAGLPEALIHPDFVLANVIASPQRGMVLVDWAGSGRGPRLWSLAFLLFSVGYVGPTRADRVAAGYRSVLRPEPEELDRLAAAVRTRPLIFSVWRFCNGSQGPDAAAADAARTAALADTIAARARAILAT
jgi:hypothetical protein